MKRKVRIKEALLDIGAREINFNSPRHHFSIERDNKLWHLAVEWGDQTCLPQFYLGPEQADRHRPHVAWDRNICFSDGEGIFFDHERPEDVLKEAVGKVLQVLTDGDDCGLEPFWDELEGYFNLVDTDKIRGTAYCYFDLDATPRKLESFISPNKRRNIKLFEDKKQCWTLHRADYNNALLGKGNGSNKGQKRKKRKPPQCYSPSAYYLPLDAPVEPPLPGEAWSVEKVISLVEPFVNIYPELKNYLKKNHQRYVFSTPRSDQERCAFAIEINPKQLAGVPIVYYRVSRHTKNFLQRRGGVPDFLQMNSLKVAVIGCGAVGGHVSSMLAQSGFQHLTLVDHDMFLAENCYRHVLPKRYIGQEKVKALKRYLEDSYLDMEISAISDTAQVWAVRENLMDHDVLILATGAPTLERYLNQEFCRIARDGQVCLAAWIEPLGLGGHVVLHAAKSKGCLNCLHTKENELIAHPLVSFIQPDQKVTRNLTGCGGAFTPFSSLDAIETATLTVRTLASYYSGQYKSIYNCWFGDNNAATQNNINTSAVFDTRFHGKNAWWDQKLQLGCSVCNGGGE